MPSDSVHGPSSIQSQLTDLFNPENFRRRVEMLKDPAVRDQVAGALAQQDVPPPDPAQFNLGQSIGTQPTPETAAGVPSTQLPPTIAPPVPPQVNPNQSAIGVAQQMQSVFAPQGGGTPAPTQPGVGNAMAASPMLTDEQRRAMLTRISPRFSNFQ